MNCQSDTYNETSVTVKDFLNGCAGNYPIEDDTFKYIAVKCNIILDEDITTVSELQRDTLELTMLRYLLRAPGMTGSVSDQNGAWSHKDGAVEMNSTDKKHLLARVHELEKKYHINNSSVKLHNYGIKQYGKG